MASAKDEYVIGTLDVQYKVAYINMMGTPQSLDNSVYKNGEIGKN